MVRVPRTEQTAADQIVDLMFIGCDVGGAGRRGGRDDRVMIADLGIVNKAPAQRTLSGARRNVLPIGILDRLYNARQRRSYIERQVTAVGTWTAPRRACRVSFPGSIAPPVCAGADPVLEC
jgi:hypothetical protein